MSSERRIRSDPPVRSDPPDVEIFRAVPFDDYDNETSAETSSVVLTEPLLKKKPEKANNSINDNNDDCSSINVEEGFDELQSTFLQKTRNFASVIGLIVGCFIQFSSLGANFILTSMWGVDAFFNRKFVVLSVAWCFATSIMGVLILVFIRGLVVAPFRAVATTTKSAIEATAVTSTRGFIAELITTIENRFAVFSLVGVCLSWTITDIVLGMKGHIVHCVLTLAVALIWCKMVAGCCAKKHHESALMELSDKDGHSNFTEGYSKVVGSAISVV